MQTLQKLIAQIRALEHEEIDLIGGALSSYSEATHQYTYDVITYSDSSGHTYTVTVPGDVQSDDGIVSD